LAPKTAARLVGFEGVLGRLGQRRPLDWAELAGQAGSADQAHLVRDFGRFTGTTPTQFLARTRPPDRDGVGEVNSVQDPAAVAS
jgi:hypothetical protein